MLFEIKHRITASVLFLARNEVAKAVRRGCGKKWRGQRQ